MLVRSDCRHFRGHAPCAPHKATGVHCDSCPDYLPTAGRILIIKLGAAGDVIRSTPLLRPLRRDHPRHSISWITLTPELLPALVDDPLPLDAATMLWARNTPFDLLINLDKEREACALATEVRAARKLGFVLGDNGLCAPAADGPARAKWLTGLFDDLSQANTLSYPQEVFAICGYTFAGEEYVLDRPLAGPTFDLPDGRAVVGLNTGCGARWKSRLWPEESWAALARALRNDDLAVVLLGGPAEDARNRRLAEQTGACYPGHFDLGTFVGLVDRCDVVVTAVTMAMHVAIGLRKQLVLINNIFNRREFELYGRGEIVEPPDPCRCYFLPTCRAERFCLESLQPGVVRDAVCRRLG